MTGPNLSTESLSLPDPGFLYGTAWKENDTERLTRLALKQGFRGIDTANQRKHYDEAAVGAAIQSAIQQGVVSREELFLQTKFTFRGGQDHRLPYELSAPIPTQVQQSFASSLEHLKSDWIDSYVLHGPTRRNGLGAEDWSAWRTMEDLHDSGRVRTLGVSNVALDQLQILCQSAHIQPGFVQNRCYATQAWDRDVREYCRRHGIVYQGFSLLTANRDVVMSAELKRIAMHYGRLPSQIIFRFAIDIGVLPLTGTTTVDHMQSDLSIFDFQLNADDIRNIESLAIR